MRFAEIVLLALPFVVFLAWRLMAPTAGPPLVLVVGVTGAVAAMAVLLLVLWYQDASPPGTGYVPARLEDGRIVPGRVEHIVPGRVEHIVPGRVEQSVPGRVEQSVPPR